MSRHAGDVTFDIVTDLRGYQPLVDRLPERQAIYEGHPTDNHGYPVSVTVTSIFDGSTPHRGVTGREFRTQITVVGTRGWRESQDAGPDNPGGRGGLAEMQAILGDVADRLDRQKGLSTEIALGSEGGPAPQELDDGRLAISNDWRAAGWYVDV